MPERDDWHQALIEEALSPVERVKRSTEQKAAIHTRGSRQSKVLYRAYKNYVQSDRPMAKKEARAFLDGVCAALAASLDVGSDTAVFLVAKDAVEAAGPQRNAVNVTAGQDRILAFITWEAEIREDIDRRLAALT